MMDILNSINQPIIGQSLPKDKVDPKKQNYNSTISTTKPSVVDSELELNSTQNTSVISKTFQNQDQLYSHQIHQAMQGLRNYGKEQSYTAPLQKETWYTSLADKIGSPELQSAADAYAQSKAKAQEAVQAITEDSTAKVDLAKGIDESYPKLVTAAENANKSQSKGALADPQNKEADDSKSTSEQKDSPKATQDNAKKSISGKELTEEELQQVKDLEARDKEVRVHEQAHQAAGGQYAGSPKYSYETGPDGRRYITDGEVTISISEESDPAKTIEKMRIVKRAALAPQEPSAQDRKVYNDAHQKELAAQQELNKEKQAENEARTELSKSGTNPTQENIDKYVEQDKKKSGSIETPKPAGGGQPQSNLSQIN